MTNRGLELTEGSKGPRGRAPKRSQPEQGSKRLMDMIDTSIRIAEAENQPFVAYLLTMALLELRDRSN